MFEYSFDNKRYHTLNYYFKNKFNKKVFKVNLNANFTCPNRDGSKGYGGCIFCSSNGSGDTAGDPRHSLDLQFETIKNRQSKKWPDAYYVGYFQAFSNTYADISILKAYYELILEKENVVGLHIATRPDCISDEVIEYLVSINKKCDLWIELGLQSSNDNTARYLNRGHTFNEYKECVKKLRSNKIKVCTHIINGIKGEKKEDMLNTVEDIVSVGIDGIKIHMMHIVKGSMLAKMYKEKPFELLTQEQFIEITVKQLQIIPKQVVVFRVGGDAPLDLLIAPMWTTKKFVTLNNLDKKMKILDVYQGDNIKKSVSKNY